MTEYIAATARALIEGLEPPKIDAPTERDLGAAIASLEDLEEILTRLPAAELRGAVSLPRSFAATSTEAATPGTSGTGEGAGACARWPSTVRRGSRCWP